MCEPSQCYAACSCAPAALKRAHKPDGGGGGAAAEPSEGTVIADGAVDEMLMRCSARAGAMSRPRVGQGEFQRRASSLGVCGRASWL